jgi:hypothetical protein
MLSRRYFPEALVFPRLPASRPRTQKAGLEMSVAGAPRAITAGAAQETHFGIIKTPIPPRQKALCRRPPSALSYRRLGQSTRLRLCQSFATCIYGY